MLAPVTEGQWRSVELVGWTRRAYGRRIMYESEGGTLRSRIIRDTALRQLYLQASITGRMLVQVYCNDRLVYDELVSNAELDTFVDLDRGADVTHLEIELHFIPATFGEVKVPQAFKVVQTGAAMQELLNQG